jgi:cytochrome c553
MRRVRHWLRIAAVLVLLALAGGFLFAWSGLYNVAASRGHYPFTEWLLTFVMENSVEARAPFMEAPPALDDPDLIRLGAAHFQGHCASCHGAPGIDPDPVMQAALPPAPDLGPTDGRWSDKELFWIVQNGIKYTGMPAWPTLARADEVWAVVAFVKRYATLDEESYRALLGGRLDDEAIRRRVASEDFPGIAESCLLCHGTAEARPISDLVPVLQGQSSADLANALIAFKDGTRPSGIMQSMAAALGDADLSRLAEYYAGLKRPEQPAMLAPPSELGRTLAERGVPEREIPPCLACHRHDADPAFPRLAGQNASYLANQIRLWRKGINTGTPAAEIMAPIARRLNDTEIDAISAYFAALSDDAAEGMPP